MLYHILSYLICLNVSGNSDNRADAAPKLLFRRARDLPAHIAPVRTAAAATTSVTRLPPVMGLSCGKKPEPAPAASEKKRWKLRDHPGRKPVVKRPPYGPDARFNPQSGHRDVTTPDLENNPFVVTETEPTEDELAAERLLQMSDSDSLDEPCELYPSFPSVPQEVEEFGPCPWRTFSDPLPPIASTPTNYTPMPQPPQAKKKSPASLRRRLLGTRFADASKYSVSAAVGPLRGSFYVQP